MALGIDLGGTSIKTAVVDITGAPVGEGHEKTPAEAGVEACVEAMLVAAGEAISKAGLRREQLTGAGIGVPGVVLPAKAPGLAGRTGQRRQRGRPRRGAVRRRPECQEPRAVHPRHGNRRGNHHQR